MLKKQITLILPCYNPEMGWSEKVIYYYSRVTEAIVDTELFLIVVNDGTAKAILNEEVDKLRQEIANFSFYSYDSHKGKGFALRYGVAKATTPSIIYTDLDFPYTIDSVCRVVRLLVDIDVVIGIKSKDYYKHVPFWRRRISKWHQRLTGVFFPSIITTDTQCGLKGFKGRAKNIFMSTRINNYLYDLEFIVNISKAQGISFILDEVQLRDNVRFSHVSVNILVRETVNFLKIILSRR